LNCWDLGCGVASVDDGAGDVTFGCCDDDADQCVPFDPVPPNDGLWAGFQDLRQSSCTLDLVNLTLTYPNPNLTTSHTLDASDRKLITYNTQKPQIALC